MKKYIPKLNKTYVWMSGESNKKYRWISTFKKSSVLKVFQNNN